MTHPLRALLLLALLLIAALPNHAQAQAKYPIDHYIDACSSYYGNGMHAVLAYSISEGFGCAYNRGDIGPVRARALAICTSNVPYALRDAAPCGVISEDNKIIATKFVNSQRRVQRVPVALEIYDDASGQVQNATGFVSQGKYSDPASIPTQVTLDSGLEICSGTTDLTGSVATYSIKCFGKGPFTGQAQYSGVFFYEGLYRPVISFTVKDGNSYINGQGVTK